MRAVELMLQKDVSLRKALNYSGLSSSTYYYRSIPRVVAPDPIMIERVKEIAFKHPTYGTRRIAALLRRKLDTAIDRKRVRRVFIG